MNAYFVRHPEMVLGELSVESTQYGKQEVTVKPIEGMELAVQLKEAISHIQGEITENTLDDFELTETDRSIPADPAVRNFSFTNVDGKVYYRENSKMNPVELPALTAERVLGMIELRNVKPLPYPSGNVQKWICRLWQNYREKQRNKSRKNWQAQFSGIH